RKRSTSRASSARRPRMSAANGRSFRDDISAKRWLARYSITSLSVSRHFRGQDLNLRPPGYEPGELPLLHPGAGLVGQPDLHSPILFRGLALAAAVAAEHPGRREFAELVTHHVLGHEQLGELPAVVNEEGEANEVRHDRAIASPG